MHYTSSFDVCYKDKVKTGALKIKMGHNSDTLVYITLKVVKI